MNKEVKFSFDDILLSSSNITYIKSRKDIKVYRNGMLPIFTSPMLDVINKTNLDKFVENKINPILPREKEIEDFISNLTNYSDYFISCSFEQFKYFVDNVHLFKKFKNPKILVDIANGHMSVLEDYIIEAKKRFRSLRLMVGNISNPSTFKKLSNAGADYIRIGVGNGSACTTTNNTAIGYPQASLIKDCYEVVSKDRNRAQIISDGGHRTYSDVIKALGLGADYVMIGGQFSRLIESSGDNFITRYKIKVNDKIANWFYKNGYKVYKQYRGMSTKEVQKLIKSNGNVRTAEGITRYNLVNNDMKRWKEEFIDHLSSTLSYVGIKDIQRFSGRANYMFITESSYNRFVK